MCLNWLAQFMWTAAESRTHLLGRGSLLTCAPMLVPSDVTWLQKVCSFTEVQLRQIDFTQPRMSCFFYSM